MKKNFWLMLVALIVVSIGAYAVQTAGLFAQPQQTVDERSIEELPDFNELSPPQQQHPLSIEYMRVQEYPGSNLFIEESLTPGSNYQRYIASYYSEGLKQYGLLTIPSGEVPTEGWPAIIFNHGYIPPEQYRTTERYVAYLDAFARNQYVVFKPDYRGHGNSEGNPEGGYFSPAYTTDVLNAFSSVQQHPAVNPQKIGMWGHSMGGHLTLRSMVINPEIKAGVIWGGVVASYDKMFEHWNSRRARWSPSPREQEARRKSNREVFTDLYGSFEDNPEFWQSISPNYFVKDLSVPIQIHHGTADDTVPLEFSEQLRDQLAAANRSYQFFSYQGGDHNLSGIHFTPAIQRSVEFFDQHLKSVDSSAE